MEEGKAQSSKSLNPHLAAFLIYQMLPVYALCNWMDMVYQGSREQYTVPTLPNSFGLRWGSQPGVLLQGRPEFNRKNEFLARGV